MPTQAIIERITALAQQGRFARVASKVDLGQQLLLRDGKDAYYTAEEWPRGTHLLKDHRNGVGDLRMPRKGRAVYLHSTSIHGRGPNVGDGDAVTLAFRIKKDSSANVWLVSKVTGSNYQWGVWVGSTTQLQVVQWQGGGSNHRVLLVSGLDLTSWTDVAISMTAGAIRVSVDGAESSNTDAGTGTWGTSGGTFSVGERADGYAGGLCRIKDLVVAEADLWDDRNDLLNNPGGYGALAHYPMEEEAGVFTFDATGNGHRLTWTNATLSTLHDADSGVPKSWANAEGSTLATRLATSAAGTAWEPSNTWIAADPVSGDFQVAWYLESLTIGAVFGLQLESTPSATGNYQRLDYGVQWVGSSKLRFFENGSATDVTVTLTTGELLSFQRSGSTVSAYLSGVLIHSFTGTTVSDLYAAATFSTTGVPPLVLARYDGQDPIGGHVGSVVTDQYLVVPRISGADNDALGAPSQYTGPCPHPGLYLTPVVGGDGAAVHVEIGQALVPESGDFKLRLWFYYDGTTGKIIAAQNDNASGTRFDLRISGSNLVRFAYVGHDFYSSHALVTGEWNEITLERSAGDVHLTLSNSGGASTTDYDAFGASTILQVSTELLAFSDSLHSAGRIGLVTIETGGVTKHVLFDGTRTVWVVGDDGSAATGSVVNGDLATIFANRSPGLWRDPRIEYGGRRVLENLWLWSEELDNSWWLKGSMTVTADDAVAPSGTMTAEKLTPTTSTATHAIFADASVESGVTYTASLYVKAAGYDVVKLYFSDLLSAFPSGSRAVFDLAAASVIEDTTGGGAAIEDTGDGWYRISATETAATTTATGRVVVSVLKGNSLAWSEESYAGDGTSGIHAWGAQLAATDAVPAYSKTTDSAATERLVPLKLDGSAYADGEAVDTEADAHVPAAKFADLTAAIDRTGGVPASVFAYHSSAPTEELVGDDVKTSTGSLCRKRTVGVYTDRLGSGIAPLTSATADAYFGD